MSDANDPPRLRSPGAGASAEARALLEVLRSERPDAAQLARLARRLPSVMIGASLALVVLGAAWVVGEMTTPPASPLPRSVPVALTSPLPASAPVVVAPPAPIAAQPPEPHASPSPSVPPAGAAAALVDAPTEDIAVAPAPSAPPPAGVGGVDTFAGFETEVELLQRAQRALPGDPARALAAAEEHRRRFTGGVLAQEREVIAISALAALGQRGEARVRAARFVASYPRSAHRPGVEALVPGLAVERLDQKSDPDRGPTPDQ